MFKYNLYSIRDDKVGFMVPTADPNDAVAIRSFTSACKRAMAEQDERVYDLSLYRVGSFNIDSGQVESLDPPVHLVSSVSVIGGDE